MKYLLHPCKQVVKNITTLVLLLAFGLMANAQAGKDSKGKDFWLTFPQNLTGAAYLYISGEVNGTGNVSAPGIGFSQNFTTTVGQITTITLPTSVFLTSSTTIQNNGIHITSNQEVTVYGMNLRAFTTDAYLGLPTDALGLEYLVMSYTGSSSQIGMVATQNATSVSFKLKATTGIYIAGTNYTITLNQGQTFFLQTSGDLTGSVVTSNKPIAVFSGNQCTNVPSNVGACDHLVEQMPPTDGWGKNFVSIPLKTRTADTYRFLASVDNTIVSVNGVVLTTLNRGQFVERIYNTSLNITATQPILVAQYANGSGYDGANADPFMMLISPYEQFLGSYTVNTPSSGFAFNFVNVVAPNSAVGTIKLDGVTIPNASFTTIGATGYSGAQIAVSIGVHTLTSNGLPFGVSAYGFNNFDSYGYPAGASYSPIASVTNIDITPKTGSNPIGTSSCFTAKVVDQYGSPVVGVRVDFTITGVNSSNSGFANTDASGNAVFCYAGSVAGSDVVRASVGTLADQANFTWTAPATALHFNGWGNTNPGGSNTNPSVFDYVSVPDNGTLDLGNTYTIEAKVFLNDNSNNTIIDKGNYRYLFQTHPNGNSGLGLYNPSMGWIYSGGTVPTNVWAHVAVTFDVPNNRVTFYLNGNVLSTHTGALNPGADNGIVTIGMQQPGFCNCNNFDGKMDELRIWNRALCQGEIQAYMNCELNPAGQTGLAALYNFNQGFTNADNSSVTVLNDISGNNNNGTLTNFALNGATSNWTAGTLSGTCSAFVAPVASITAGGATIFCAGSSVTLTANSGASYLWSTGATSQSIVVTTAGNYSVSVTSAGGCKATSVATTVTVNPLPTITCPSNITVNATSGQCGAIVTFDAASATGTPTPTITYSHASGSLFPVGTTQVTATATNSCGSVSCTFTVTVVDNENPVIANCPSTITANATSGQCGAAVSFSLPPLAPTVDQQITDIFTGTVGTDQWQSFTAGKTGLLTQVDLYRNGIQPFNGTLTIYQGVGVSGTAICTDTYALPTGNNWTNLPITVGNQPNITAGQVYTIRIQSPVGDYGVGLMLLGGSPSNQGTYYSNSYGLNPGWKLNFKTYVAVASPSISATDNCGVASFTSSHQSGDVFPVGTTPVTFTAVDNSGNTSTCTFNVVVLDTQTPTISCSSNINVTATSAAGAVVTYATPIATDNCSGVTTALTTGLVSGSTFPIGETIVTFKATDASGNTAQCSFTVTVTGLPPVIVCPSNIVVDATEGLCGAVVSFEATETTAIPASTITYSIAPGTVFNVGTTQVTATATNVVGSSSCTFTITVLDKQFPVLVGVPSSTTVECDAVPAAAVVTATDNCATSVPSYTETRTNGDCPSRYTLTRTWSTTDASGNTTTASQVITVQDTQAPVLSAAPADATVECNAVPAAAVLTATDNCDAPTVTYAEVRTNGNCPSNYTLTRTWTATDACGNTSSKSQTITVQDTQAPVLSVAPADATVECNAVPTAAVLTATDNCDAPIVTYAEVRTNGNCPSNYTLTRTWTATDACGNITTASQTITVQDTQAPVLSAAPADATVECDAVPAAVVVTATDNCDAPTVVYTQTSTQSTDVTSAGFYNYTLTRTWTATDACGNASIKTQIITVQDVTAPVITCPAIAPVCNDLAGNTKTLTLTGTDNCNSPLTVSYTVSGATVKATTVSATATVGFNVGTSYVNWTVKDATGNTTTCTTTVVIWALPVASYVTSNADAFCNKLTITANSTLSGPYSYAWSYNNAAFASTQQIQLDNTNGDGNYSVYTYDVNGCRSAVPAVYNYQKQNIISNYTILANKEVELHGYNKVQSGSVGLMKAGGKAEFEKYSAMTGAGAFVKAPKIEVDNGASVPNRVIGIATVSLPTMQLNTIASYNNLPSYTVNQNQTIALSANYKSITIRRGANVTLSGTIFGSISIEEGAVVRFTSTTINVGDMKVGRGPNNGATIVKFANNTSVRVSKQVKIEEDCIINPDGVQVTFYLGDAKCDEEKFHVKGGNTTVTANIYAPSGKIKVTGGSNCHNHNHNGNCGSNSNSGNNNHRGNGHDDDDDDDHDSHGNSNNSGNCSGGVVNMIGLFIADEVESEGKYVHWNNYTCSNASGVAPIANYADVNAAEEPVAKLEVRVAPNPTMSDFVLIVNSKTDDLVNIKVTDAYGKLVATLNKVVPGSAVRVGSNFTSGVYFAEIVQGTQRKVVKMVKGN